MSKVTFQSLFKETFKEMLVRHGFINKGRLFIRVVGKNIVQAMCIKAPDNHWVDFCVSIFPIGRFKERFRVPFANSDLSKKYQWSEDLILLLGQFNDLQAFNDIDFMKSSSYISPMFDLNDIDEGLPRAKKYMETVAKCVETFYMPMFDRIVDEESYIRWMALTETENRVRVMGPRVKQEEMIYIAHFAKDFQFGLDYIQRWKCNSMVNWLSSYARSVSGIEKIIDLINEGGCSYDDKDKILEHIDMDSENLEKFKFMYDAKIAEIKKYDLIHHQKFYDSMNQEDLSWITDYFERDSEEMLPKFKKYFPQAFANS